MDNNRTYSLSSWWSSLKQGRNLIKELRDDISHLPSLENDRSAASNEWISNRLILRSQVLGKDPRSFLRWEVIRQTMFVSGIQQYVMKELKHLQQNNHWKARYEAAIRESSVGRPERCAFYKESSGNLIHNAYSLCQFEEHSRTKVNDLETVVEFGGGYGSMCRLFHNLGFKGKYIIYDLPEFSALQKYFLKSIGLSVADPAADAGVSAGILCLSDLDTVTRAIPIRSRKLLLATWSLSETSEAVRRDFLDSIPEFNNYLIAYQKKFGEVDNASFFKAFMQTNTNVIWKSWEIAHLKDQYYLIGFGKRPCERGSLK